MKKKPPVLEPLFLTERKITELKDELKHLEKHILPEIRHRMAVAYEDGDIPENNPFLTANDDLQKAFKRRNDLRDLLARAKVIEEKREHIQIHLGSTVTVQINGQKEQQICIVESEESDPVKGNISIDSPIGKGLLGKEPGDEVEIATPAGVIIIKIL